MPQAHRNSRKSFTLCRIWCDRSHITLLYICWCRANDDVTHYLDGWIARTNDRMKKMQNNMNGFCFRPCDLRLTINDLNFRTKNRSEGHLNFHLRFANTNDLILPYSVINLTKETKVNFEREKTTTTITARVKWISVYFVREWSNYRKQ